MKVNRTLKDEAMDRIDHALGRPCDPLVETYRNHYATDDPEGFAGSPHWCKTARHGDMIFYSVTDQGRAALKAHLREIGDRHRLYVVRLDGQDMNPRAAKSHGAARYDAWLDVSDCSDISFRDFQKRSRVRLQR